MKKMLIVALVLLMAATGLHAQEAGTWTVGGRLGGAFGFSSSQSELREGLAAYFGAPNASFSDEMKFNFNFAVFGAYTIIDNLSLQMELNFMINQGLGLEATVPFAGSATFDLTYNSLDIPILLRYSFFNEAFGVLAGPHISIPLGRARVSVPSILGGGSYRFDIDTSAIFGLTTGIFGAFPVGPGSIVGDLRFLFDFNTLEVEGADAIRRRALAITVGYQMSF